MDTSATDAENVNGDVDAGETEETEANHKENPEKKSSSEMGEKADNKSPQKDQKQRTGKGFIYEVVLLDGEHVNFELDRNAEGKELFDKVCQHLDLIEKDYFGLQYVDERLSNHLKCWLSPEKKITKQKKGGPWLFDFALKFYPPDPTQLRESLTRWLVTLQVRRDVLSGKLPATFLTQAMLGSYCVQADIGDYDPNEHHGIMYVRDIPFSPNQTPELLEKIVELHKQHKGQTPDEAELNFLENAKKLSMYGVDLHAAQDVNNVDIMLGVCASGLQVYREKLRISRFVWPKILKISYKRKHFYIKVRPTDNSTGENSVSFKLQSHRLAKRLWKISVEHHAFFRLREAEQPQNSAMFPRLGSKFRYSGRTLYQTRQNSQILDRPDPYFERSQPARNSYAVPGNRSHSVDELSNRPDYWKDDTGTGKRRTPSEGYDGNDRRDQLRDPNATLEAGQRQGSRPLGSEDGGTLERGGDKSMDGRDRRDHKPGEDDATLDKDGYGGTMGLSPAELQKKAKEDEKERKKREKEEEKRRKKEEDDRKKAEKAAKKGKGKDGYDPSAEDRRDHLGGGDNTENYPGGRPGGYGDQQGDPMRLEVAAPLGSMAPDDKGGDGGRWAPGKYGDDPERNRWRPGSVRDDEGRERFDPGRYGDGQSPGRYGDKDGRYPDGDKDGRYPDGDKDGRSPGRYGDKDGRYPPGYGDKDGRYPDGDKDGRYPPGYGDKDGRYPDGDKDGRYPLGYGDKDGRYPPGYGDKDGRYPPGYGDKDGNYLPGYGDEDGRYPPGYGDKDGRYPPGYDNKDGRSPGRYGDKDGRSPGRYGDKDGRSPGRYGDKDGRSPGRYGDKDGRGPGRDGEDGDRFIYPEQAARALGTPGKYADRYGPGDEDGQGLYPPGRDRNRWEPGRDGGEGRWGPGKDGRPGQWGPGADRDRGWKPGQAEDGRRRNLAPGEDDDLDAGRDRWGPGGALLGAGPNVREAGKKGNRDLDKDKDPGLQRDEDKRGSGKDKDKLGKDDKDKKGGLFSKFRKPKDKQPGDEGDSRSGYRPGEQEAGAGTGYPDAPDGGRYSQPRKSEKDKSKRASLIASLCPGQSPSKKEARKHSASSDEAPVNQSGKDSSAVAPQNEQIGGSQYPDLGVGYGPGLGVGAGDLSGVVGDETWIDNKMSFEPIVPPIKETKSSLKPSSEGIDFSPYFSPDATSTVGRPGKVPPPVPPKGSNSSFDDSFSRTDMFKSDRDGIQETRVEHKVVLSSADDDEFDYDAALADAIRSVTEFNPDMSVERIECVQQIEEVKGK